MICPDCRGRGWTPRVGAMDDDGPMMAPCETCGGSGTASCCDTAGAAMSHFAASNDAEKRDRPSFTCPRCGAVSYNPNDIANRYCGRCHVFVDDAAPPVFVCAACGAIQQERMIRCEQCGEPLVFPKFADDPYRDARFIERACDLCGKPYQGPSVYCSLKCALDDAA